MSEEKASYRSIMKATSLFGGVQVFNILISIIRSKFVAILLGPAGLGIVGLLQSTIGLVTSLTSFSLRRVSVKDIAAAVGTQNLKRVALVVAVLRRLVWGTGLLGAFVAFITAPSLSQLTFGNKDYTTAFMWLSVTLLLNQLSHGQSVLLQGFRKLKLLAKANVFGSFISLLVTIPIYYYCGEKGIVPVMIMISLTTLLLTWYFSRKVPLAKVTVSASTTFAEGKEMLTMGFTLSMSSLLTVATYYVLNIYIRKSGGIEDVGLYNSGFAIIGTYVGMIFSAMGTDYYPRLAAIAHNNSQAKMLINQQAEVALLILAPILGIFIVFIKWMVILLYSSKFISITWMINWAALGMFFKAVSWSIAFIFLAKGRSTIFFWNEFMVNCYLLVLNIIGYYFWGLTGLGISFLITYILYTLQVFVIAKLKYNFSFSTNFIKIFSIQLTLGVLCFIAVYVLSEWISYAVGSVLIAVSTLISWKELDNRLDIKEIIAVNYKKLLKKKKK
tara:strand:- start:2382 stop:3881 length:1500 start_codon:yes stop_codon:yes gene_type:complete